MTGGNATLGLGLLSIGVQGTKPFTHKVVLLEGMCYLVPAGYPVENKDVRMEKMNICVNVRRSVSVMGSLIIPFIATLIPAYADEYSVGSMGPAGGIVFYLNESGGGLEAAPTDQGLAAWGCIGTTISGAGETAIGTGQQNTADILASGCSSGSAADVASSYMGPDGATGDWFLPSKDALYQLYLNRKHVGGFSSVYYWSSSESDDFFASSQSFQNGTDFGYLKKLTIGVRAVRGF